MNNLSENLVVKFEEPRIMDAEYDFLGITEDDKFAALNREQDTIEYFDNESSKVPSSTISYVIVRKLQERIDEIAKKSGIVIPLEEDVFLRDYVARSTYKILGFSRYGAVLVDITTMINNREYNGKYAVSEISTEDLHSEYIVNSKNKLSKEAIKRFKEKIELFEEIKYTRMDEMCELISDLKYAIDHKAIDVIDYLLAQTIPVKRFMYLCSRLLLDKNGVPVELNVNYLTNRFNDSVSVYPGLLHRSGAWVLGVFDLNNDHNTSVLF